MNKIVLGLPAFNEEQSLPPLIARAVSLRVEHQLHMDILIVDDGSQDTTWELAERYAQQYPFVRAIRHEHNRGLGTAIQTIISAATDSYDDGDVLVIMDADNTHSPQLIPGLVRKLEQERLDLVIASRFVPGGMEIGLSWVRRLLSRCASLLIKLFYPIEHVRDYSCGYRAYRIGYLKYASDRYEGRLIVSKGFECMAELLAKFSKIGVNAAEYPLILQYDLKHGKSKMKVLRTIRGYLRLLSTV